MTGSSAVDLSIIIVSFNTREMTLACLRSVFTQTTDTQYEIVVVDNNSEDGSAEAIRAEFPTVQLLAMRENLGFAGANNLAANYTRGRKLLLLNPDTVVLDRAIDHLFAFAHQNPERGIWGGRTVFADGSLNPTSCLRRISLWTLFCFAFGLTYLAPNSRIFSPENYGGWKRDTVRDVDIVTGCFLMIERSLWDELGGFDPTFFMYGEEADLCQRAYRLGARPMITPDATIIHYKGASETTPLERRIKLFKGRMTLINRHFSPSRVPLARLLHMLVPITRWFGAWMVGSLLSRPALIEAAAHWRETYRRRREWMYGYPPQADPLSRAARSSFCDNG